MLKYLFVPLSSISFISYIYVGIYILFLDYKSSLNRNFLYFCLSFALWSFGYIILFITGNIIGLRIGRSGAAIFSVFVLKFFMILSNIRIKDKYKLFFHILIWIIPFLRIYRAFFIYQNFNDFHSGIWLIIYIIYTNILCFTSISLLLRIIIKSRSKREKKQARIIMIGAIITILIGYSYDFIFGLEKTLASSINLIWIFSIWYAIVKYRFLSITPNYVSNDIIKNIDEAIMLLNHNGEVITINEKAKSILGNIDINEQLRTKIYNFEYIENKINNLLKGELKSFTYRLHALNDEKKKIFMDINCSLIKDKFDDILGVLIIGKEIKGIEQLRKLYKITDREIDIILNIITGKTNEENSKIIGISLNTMKRHITNIYNKLGVDNKVHLMNLLKDFNFIPEQKAEKTVYLLRKPNNKNNN